MPSLCCHSESFSLQGWGYVIAWGACVHVCVFTRVGACLCTCAHRCIGATCACMCVCMWARVCAGACTCECACMRIDVHVYVRACALMHILCSH